TDRERKVGKRNCDLLAGSQIPDGLLLGASKHDVPITRQDPHSLPNTGLNDRWPRQFAAQDIDDLHPHFPVVSTGRRRLLLHDETAAAIIEELQLLRPTRAWESGSNLSAVANVPHAHVVHNVQEGESGLVRRDGHVHNPPFIAALLAGRHRGNLRWLAG